MTTQKIVPLGKDMEYLDAFNATKSRGGLPSNVLHDDTLMNAGLLEKIRQDFSSYYGAWCREMIAYPSKYGAFGKGNIKDSDYNWVLQARYVPKAAIGKKGIALLIDPKDLQVVGDQVRVIPRTVTILKDFPQTDGLYDYDRKTRMPIDKEPKTDRYEDARRLWRWDSQSLRPLARYYGGGYDFRRVVGAGRGPGDRLGVGVVEPQRKLPLNDAELNQPKFEECFETKIGKDRTIKIPKSLKVKTGWSVEVTVRTR